MFSEKNRILVCICVSISLINVVPSKADGMMTRRRALIPRSPLECVTSIAGPSCTAFTDEDRKEMLCRYCHVTIYNIPFSPVHGGNAAVLQSVLI